MDGDEAEEVQIFSSDKESLSESAEKESPVESAELKLRAIITEGSLDFDGWTALIAAIEKTYPDDIEKICLVYESFLSEFPLCYGYWRKYADHKTHLCTVDKVVEVFERAVQSASYSVHVWVDYCSFSMSAFEDPCDVRRLFKRGLSFVGKDYLCHTLWDKFIEFELSQQQWSSLAHIYIQSLRFPTKKLHRYYDSFKKLVSVWEEEMECQSNTSNELQPMHDNEVPTSYKDDEIKSIIIELLDPSIGSARSHALSKYLSIGEHFYKTASQLDEKLCCFETHIRRSYFHVKPLDVSQLENWHHYLDFVEAQGDFDWAVKLNERCLIPCSNYPEFWMRYVEFMETKGGRELTNFALDRATQIFVKRVPVIHLFNARFKEQVGDILGSRAAILQCDAESDSSFVENVIRKANIEKRLGNYVAASNIYIKALEMAAVKEKLQDLPLLYVHFSRLKFLTTDSADAARDILIDGIKHVYNCKLLLQELINFAMMHGGARHIVLIDSVMASTVFSELGASQGLSAEEREEISNLYLEFVDLCGTIHDIRNAWNRHIKWFPFSLRTPATVAPSHATIEERKENFVAMLRKSSGNCSDDCVTRHPSPDKIQLHPENYGTRSNDPTSDQISDQNSPLQINQDIESDEVVIDQQEADVTRHGVQQVSEVSEQPKEDVAEPIVSSPHLLHEVANESESVPASRGYPKNTLQEEYDHESEQNVKPLSLERLSLNAEDNKSPSSIPTTSHDYEAPQERCTSNGSMESGHNTGNRRLYSQICNQTSDFANIQRQAASPSSSASYQNPTTHAPSQPHMPADSSRNWHQIKYNNRMRRDSKFGFRGHSQKRPHQQRHNSSQQQYPWAEMGTQMPLSQGFAPLQNSQADQCNQASNQYQAHASLSQAHGSLMQNVQQPSQSQLSAQSVAYPQSQMVQYPTQGNLQYGNVQNSEAYNQMWQYYYYQQQQQQQFFLQQQQQLLQQQQLDPQQQQLLQQQYQQQLQLQQQYFYQQQQQFQQLSEQQQQQFQQMSQQQQQQEPDQAHLQQQPSQSQQLQQEQQLDQQQQFNTQEQLQQQQYLQQQQLSTQQQLQQQQFLQQQQLLQQQHLLYMQQLQQSQMQKQGEEQEQPSQQQQQQQQQDQVYEQHHQQKYYDSSSHLEVESRPWITESQVEGARILQYYDSSSHLEVESRPWIMESQSRGVTPPQNDLKEATGSVLSAALPQRQERSPTISV